MRGSAPGLLSDRAVREASPRGVGGPVCGVAAALWQARLVGLGSLALDGTKLRANASRRKAMSYERMMKREQQLESEIAELQRNVERMLREADRVDAEEDKRFGPDKRGDELPAELQRREQRLEVLREAKQALEKEAFERETKRRAELEAEGKKPGATRDGRDPFKPRPTAQAIVEPVFGQMNTVQDARRLLLRGKQAARDQWRFQCAIHNLPKLHRNGGLALLTPR